MGSLISCSSACPDGVNAPPVSQGRVLADLHCHPTLNDWNALSPIGVQNPTLARLVKSLLNRTGLTWKTSYQAGIDLLCAAHFNMFDEWLSMPTDPNPGAIANTLRMMNLLEEELDKPEAKNYARIARNAGELKRLVGVSRSSSEFRTAVVHAIEGGHALGGNPAALDELARRGVAMITVSHFFSKGLGSAGNAFPFFPDANSRWPHQGLTELGLTVVGRMQELGIIVDVSHGTCATVESILRHVSCPIVATHSSARTLGDHPYSLYDEHIQEIAQRGGIVGVIIMPYWLSNFGGEAEAVASGTLDDVVRTIVYIAKLVGPEHIGLGSDFSGFIPGPRDMSCLAQIDLLRSKIVKEFDEPATDRIMAQNVIDFILSNWTYPGRSPARP